ncbi:MAG TPA: sodium:solute symporter family protein [Thermoanaerobaculia bacterium]|nr:sodium:solute symporter family protein [Thermoanaerobaculia bacterium]
MSESPGPEVAFGPGALVVMAGYLVVMLLLGWLGRVSRKEESLRDFYLGGSSFGLAVLFLTLFATQYSGNTLLGFAGRSYQQGLTYVVAVTFMILVVSVLMVYAPRLFRLSRKFGYITPADFVFHRFGSHPLRALSVLLLCWGLANYVLEQLVAMGHAVEAISGGRIGFMQGVLLLALVMLVYESLGGMRSVAWTDVVQGSLLLAGCGAVLWGILASGGGLPEAAASVAEHHPARLDAPGARDLRVWISNLVLLGLGVAIYPHAIQRLFAARELRSLRRSLALMAFMPLVTTLLAVLIGFVGLGLFPELSGVESDRITVYVLGSMAGGSAVAYWLVVLVLAGVVAAIMSTADSALLSMGSMLTKDLYLPYVERGASRAKLLRVGKVLSWAIMALLILMAWISLETESSLWLLIKLKLEFMVQLVPVLVLGVHWRGFSASAALAGMVGGTVSTLVLWIGAAAGWWTDRSPAGISAGVWGLALNLALCVALSLWQRRPAAAASDSRLSGSRG